jgi:hypothetical protein
MTPREALEHAIAAARPRCLECGNDHVTAEYAAALGGWIPVSHHWAATPADACPVLAGGAAAWLAHEDLWAALEPYLFVADYGEAAWARRELVSA